MNYKAYQCAAGVWTIGYGHTKGVQPGDEWSEDHANHMLEVELEEYENYVSTAVTVPLSQNQFDALVSWVYNLGNGNLTSSTMLKVLNSGDYAGVPAQIKRWNKAGGKVLEGLTRRRQAEADMFEGTVMSEWWAWLSSLWTTYYRLTVSYNAIYGDSDDTVFTVKKFYYKQDKYLKFKTSEGEIVEIRGAEGLNYKIEEL